VHLKGLPAGDFRGNPLYHRICDQYFADVTPFPVAWATPESRYVVIRLWHPWLRINRVLRVMLHTHWSAETWSQVRVEFKRALALRSEIRRAGLFN
jgi:hypothetical protein